MDFRKWRLGGRQPFFLIAGPCVIESEEHALGVAARLREITSALDVPFIFKASYDKANRTSIRSFRGPGLGRGLEILGRIRRELGVAVTSDVHEAGQVGPAAEVLDLLQIPAFLCRQTDLIVAAAATGRPVNIKKGQFLAPGDLVHAVEKARSTGNGNLLVTERGTSFGYHNLVVDFRSLPLLRKLGVPVVFDATHSVQLPGGAGGSSSGESGFIPYLARAAVAVGVDGLFMEVHPDPERALSDGANALQIDRLKGMLTQLRRLDALTREAGFEPQKPGEDGRAS
ncbi:MAG: 3-deoxy-8-phosphooctulonate synthase [Candidatus Aminicenantes bacterium]|nr:3-deoxy-8-phosphooctulonate synthase [Candidatus Aminicenantes bacterium]